MRLPRPATLATVAVLSGLSLLAGGALVELTDFVVDPGASVLTGTVSVNGEVAAEGAPLFFLDGRTL